MARAAGAPAATPCRRRYNAAVSGAASFAERLLDWHRGAGRHDLPWQHPRTPYRVWISEIMLQQTQVATVLPYYQRFLARFPDVHALAAAEADEVLHLWSGLGYYARARNLQRAAQVIRDQHGGAFPEDFAAVAALPGIGRSTAGAILALACGQRHPILDGNARRVLARHFAVGGAAGEHQAQARLWQLAEACTPGHRLADYTQAIMDLGATVCTRRHPACTRCPLALTCRAWRAGRPTQYPQPRRRAVRGRRELFFIVALNERNEVLLEQRPPRGIWGGLWSLPEFATASAARRFALDALPAARAEPQPLDTLEHGFTHFDLLIRPLLVRCRRTVTASPTLCWVNIRAPGRIGLPAPVAALLEGLSRQTLFDAA